MADPVLLSYLVSTSPVPLQTTTTTASVTGTINLYVAEPATVGYCNQITIAVPIGTTAGCLFTQTPTASVNTGKWVQSSLAIVKGGTFGLANNIDYAQFIYDCQNSADFDISYNLVFSLAGATGGTPADCMIPVLENSGPVNDPATFVPRQINLPVSLVPPRFYLNNLVATATGSPTVPRTEFANGATINFAWESNGTWFQLFQKGMTIPIYAGLQTSTSIPNGAATDTTYFLVASMTGDPDQDQAGFDTIYLYDSLSVTISNPDLTPRTVTAAGTIAAGGGLSVTGNASVSGTATLGSALVGNSLNVTGAASLAGTTVNGPFQATGNSTLSATTINGAVSLLAGATVRGGVNLQAATVAAMGGAISVAAPGSYTAKTDGLLVGRVGWAASNSGWCRGYLSASNSDGVNVVAFGGNVLDAKSDGTKGITMDGGSLFLPLRSGTSCSLAVWQDSWNESGLTAPVACYFVPIGSVTGGAAIERLADTAEHVIAPASSLVWVPRPKEAYLEQLVELIGELTERPIPHGRKMQLLGLLRRLTADEYDARSVP